MVKLPRNHQALNSQILIEMWVRSEANKEKEIKRELIRWCDITQNYVITFFFF